MGFIFFWYFNWCGKGSGIGKGEVEIWLFGEGFVWWMWFFGW